MINGARKIYVPFWVDSVADADDPYTTDCSLETTKANPHAYAEFTIVNGELDYESFVCVEKAPGIIANKRLTGDVTDDS